MTFNPSFYPDLLEICLIGGAALFSSYPIKAKLLGGVHSRNRFVQMGIDHLPSLSLPGILLATASLPILWCLIIENLCLAKYGLYMIFIGVVIAIATIPVIIIGAVIYSVIESYFFWKFKKQLESQGIEDFK